MDGEFKSMHFTQINLLHDLPSGKYMFFFLLKKSCEKYGSTQQAMFLTSLKMTYFLP